MTILNLSDIIKQIENDDLLLPDFQRNFVWNDEMQRKLIASVLTKLPLGSLLILESKGDSYNAKKIGTKLNKPVNSSDVKSFLLDGQQRVTVLVNVFSNSILRSVSAANELIHGVLKTRYFLKFKNVRSIEENLENDIFGINHMNFKYTRTELPEYSSSDVYDYICGEVISLNRNKTEPFDPTANYSKIDEENSLLYACNRVEQDEYLIPLFLLEKDNFVLQKCLRGLMNFKKEAILGFYENNNEEKIKKLFEWCEIEVPLEDDIALKKFLDDRIEEWCQNFTNFLMSCTNPMELSIIEVKSEERSRAIDIYENLNRGGVSLNSFDLILAVASISCKDFYEKFKENLNKDFAIDETINRYGPCPGEWSAYKYMRVYNENKNSVSTKYIEVFLNLLSIVNNTDELTCMDKLKLETIKREKILSLTTSQIKEEFENVQIAINKALGFLQFRCGLISIDDLPYKHLLLGISAMYFKCKTINMKKANFMECWYLSSIFSGEYDSDQTPRILADIKNLDKLFENPCDNNIGFLSSRIQNTLKSKRFSDKDTLLYKDLDHLPKKVITDSLINFILSQGCLDFTKVEERKLYAFQIAEQSIKTEIHHIVPLKEGVTIRESTSKIRKDTLSKYNSPLNLTIISASANSKISSNTIDSYFRNLPKGSFHDHLINTSYDENTNIDSLISERFDTLEERLKSHLKNLIAI